MKHWDDVLPVRLAVSFDRTSHRSLSVSSLGSEL